ncbi:hypothetical protein BDV95DRAFT_598039 [Massariosphaeria phaeospora]|uniref:Uncharacterized protein n=1 Tax=Massariosphaeria phaeospora TaxID=100035 RepID=A0A7C8MHM7_9PLEO|nr:hypothetical protein BDV95DRAFT_598039 [Massariosphaeria phaeospora]
MFGRKRAASNPALKQPPSASASLAATKAFVKDRDSIASLSNAAAAAALRTHPNAPTPVGDTVTKRMVRRGSASSHGSGSQQPPGLRRHSSSGSMAERSFRAPSPSRSSAIPHNAPPVPAVPKQVPQTGVVYRRASSLEPTFRGASPIGRGGGRGVSLDRGAASTPTRGHGPASRVTNLSQVQEDDQDDNPRPGSVNFSRPISPPQSPTPTKSVAAPPGGQSGWFGGPVVNKDQTFRGGPQVRPKTNDGLWGNDLHSAAWQSVQNAADRPVAKAPTSHRIEGARLATGSLRSKPSGSHVSTSQTRTMPPTYRAPAGPVDPKSPYAVFDPSTRTFIHKQDAMARHRALSDDIEEPQQRHVPQHVPQTQPHQSAHHHVSWQRESPVREPIQRTPSPSPQRVQRLQSPVSIREERRPAPGGHVDTETVEHELPAHNETGLLARRPSEDYAELDLRPSRNASTNPEKSHDSPISPKGAGNQGSSYPRFGTPVNPTPITTESGRGGVKSERTHSLSPPRNAHFAPVALELPNDIKHQPPPRSVSPAKSALKLSPSVSRRDGSPLATNGRVVGAPSEASDTDEGLRKKRKNVRVSFDEDPVIAGTSAYVEPEITASPTGLGAYKWDTGNQEQDIDDVMKPRPALPSFGSVRKDRRQEEDERPEKVTETVSSSMSTSIGSIGEPLEASSDRVVGGILAKDFAAKKASQSPLDPLPPEVTSVEGSGYVSDSDQSDSLYNDVSTHESAADGLKPEEQSVPKLEPKTLTTPIDIKPLPLEVPFIAIQPASPSPGVEKPEPRFHLPMVPGGWGDEDEDDHEVNHDIASNPATVPVSSAVDQNPSQLASLIAKDKEDESSDDNSSIYSDAYEDLSDLEDGGFGSIDALVESPVISPSSGSLFLNYQDITSTDRQQSNLRNEYAGDVKDEGDSTSGDGDAARLRQSELNDPLTKVAEEHSPILREAPTAPVSVPIVRAPVKQSNAATEYRAPTKSEPTAPESSPRQPSQPRHSSAQPRKSALKKAAVPVQPPIATESRPNRTMRANAPSDVSPPKTQMKKSMRNGMGPGLAASPETHMRKSMRSMEPTTASRAPPGLAASRHSMPPVDAKPPRGALQKRSIPAAAAAPRSQPQPASKYVANKPMAPVQTYDSDSDGSASSFRRSRPRGGQNQGGRYTMRGSMRSGPPPTTRPAPTMRPISPPPVSSPPPAALRKSMRPSSPSAEPAASRVKSSKFSIRSLSPAGRFRSSKIVEDAPPLPAQPASPRSAPVKTPTFGKPPKAKAPAAVNSKPRFNSRFADSSDEDEDDRFRGHQSRFADSDEEEDFALPSGLTPVRGIPRKVGEQDGDSTDLEEEASDDERSTAKNIEKGGQPAANGVANGQGTSFTAESLRKSKYAPELPTFEGGKKPKAKRGFFGFGKKKTEMTPAAGLQPQPQQTAGPADASLPFDQSNRTRPLTPIGEDKAIEMPTPSPRSPKLQRRSTPQWGRSASDSWPLPQPAKIGDEPRPQSSDGVTTTVRRTSLRPTLNKRHSSQVSEARTAVDPTSAGGRAAAGKKKKFSGLRRVFGLND